MSRSRRRKQEKKMAADAEEWEHDAPIPAFHAILLLPQCVHDGAVAAMRFRDIPFSAPPFIILMLKCLSGVFMWLFMRDFAIIYGTIGPEASVILH